MYCTNCGKKITDEAMFCPFCGAPTLPDLIKPEEPAGEPVSVNEPVRSGVTVRVGKSTLDLAQIVEMLAGIVGFLLLLPLMINAVSNVLGFITYTLIRPMIFARKAIIWIVRILSLAELLGLGYLIFTERYKEKTIPGIAAGTALLVFIATLLSRYSTIFALLAIAAMVPGFDLFLKVFIRKTGLQGTFDLQGDLDYIQEAYRKTETIDPAQYTDVNIPKYEATVEIDPLDSYFDGSGIECLGYIVVMILLTMFTCGLCLPWGIVRFQQWEKSHTVIEGQRLSFNGTAMQLFGLWLKWFLLTVITCGIYSFFAYVDLQKWITKHTTYVGMELPEGNEYMASFFDGNTFEYIGYGVMTYILCVCTCGIAYPWCATMLQKWQNKSTVIEGDRLFYDGTGGGLFATYIICFLLTLITCGIYSPWAYIRFRKYIVNHVHVDATYNGMRVG